MPSDLHRFRMAKQEQPFHEAFSMTAPARPALLETRESGIKLMFLTPKGQPRDKTDKRRKWRPASRNRP